MSKKVFTILMISTITLIITLIWYENYGYVEKLSLIKIKGLYEEEVTDYENNTSPFTLEVISEECSITVNGKEYTKGERFYKNGIYKITAKQGHKIERCKIKINTIQVHNDNTYNIYILPETLQALIGNLDVSNNVDQKGFLWTSRVTTLNLDKISETCKNIQLSKQNGVLQADEKAKLLISEISEYVKQVLQNDKNAYFKVYLMEEMFYYETEIFGKIGLNDSRYEITMYTDGTLGYVRKYDITEVDKYDVFKQKKDLYFDTIEELKKNNIEKFEENKSSIADTDNILISTLRENIRLLLQFPELRDFQDVNVKEEMKQANIEELSVRNKFEKLTDDEKEIFFDNINLDKEELDEEFFNDDSKDYLVITGTAPFCGLFNSEDIFSKVLEKVVDEFDDDYNILYKPHPRALPNKQQEEMLERFNIKVLPGTIPMEAICFIYPNLKLGGFDSSLYMSVDKGKTLFFFKKDKDNLVSPLNDLYDSLFKDAKFLTNYKINN